MTEPVSCLKCGQQPRLDGHSCCAECHDPVRCHRPDCNLHTYLFPSYPVRVGTGGKRRNRAGVQ